MSNQPETKKFPTHNNIKRVTVRSWPTKFINDVAKECKKAGYDVKKDKETLVVADIERNEVFLKSIKMGNAWLTRYDQKLFDENYEDPKEEG